ncbi:MAG TPA: sulfotransferase [Allosphingosinicella sp.]|nr:sulfotransferase [Allosphingosinicella sp.]
MPQVSPALAEAHRLIRQNRPSDALDKLAEEIKVAPCFGPAHSLELEILFAQGQDARAERAFDRALRLPARSADAFDALGFYARRLDRHELSNSLYRQAVDLAPADPDLLYNLATSERSLGQLREAAHACDRALKLSPDLLPALLLRSELARATNERNHVAELEAKLSSDRTDRCQMFVGYALGKELQDLGRYDAAFAAFDRAAAARRRNLTYDVAQDERKLRRIEEVFKGPCPTAAAPSERGHIFIIGLPRSGTTLMERILGALPNVRSNGETNNFAAALLDCAPKTPDDVFQRCSQASPAKVAAAYDRRATRAGSDRRIIEKLPQNYLYVGAIAAAFSDASIIWVRRNSVDNCFAMFRTLFGEGYPFSYTFEELARYVSAYERLMDHWNTILPGRLIEVQYEELVAAPLAIVKRVAERCGLAWSNDALDLTRNRSASLTASAPQVRGSIYTTSSGLWRKYLPHLDPLLEELRKAGVSLPAS